MLGQRGHVVGERAAGERPRCRSRPRPPAPAARSARRAATPRSTPCAALPACAPRQSAQTPPPSPRPTAPRTCHSLPSCDLLHLASIIEHLATTAALGPAGGHSPAQGSLGRASSSDQTPPRPAVPLHGNPSSAQLARHGGSFVAAGSAILVYA